MPEGDTTGRPPVEVTVVVPTRNEAPNVEALVTRLARALRPRQDWEVLFVDDSDDGTPDEVEAAQAAGWPVRLLHRRPGARPGELGAVEEGFALALGQILVVMDGDLQHPPEVVPKLLAVVEGGDADLVAGTRYGGGGQAGGLDGPWRQAVSRGGRALVHLVVPRSRAFTDPLSGLFALKRYVIDDVALRTNGFKILLELAARGHWKQPANLPYRFERRRAGRSKASVAEGRRFAQHLWALAQVRPPRGKSSGRR